MSRDKPARNDQRRRAVADRSPRALLRKLGRLLRAADDPLGRTPSHRACMRAIDALDAPVSLKRVADVSRIAPSTASKIVDGLVGLGLVVRRRDGCDRRRVDLALTELGRRWVLQPPNSAEARFLLRFGALDRVTREQIASALERVSEILSAQDPDDP